MPKTEIDKLLSEETTDEDGETQLVDGDKARIGKLTQPKKGETFQDGYKKAKAEVLTELETQLKEKYEIESDANGLELVEAIVTEKAKTGKAATPTEDDIRKSSVFQAQEKAHKAALKAKEAEWETKFNEQAAQYKKGETFNQVSKKALDILTAMNPVQAPNATVAANIQNAFLSTFKSYEFDIQDNGNRVVVMKDGKVVDDGHGNSLEFEKLVKDTAAGYYAFQQNNGGGNAGNGKPNEGGAGAAGGSDGGGGAAYPAGITKPKDWEGVVKIINDTSIKPEDRQTVLTVWENEQKTGTNG